MVLQNEKETAKMYTPRIQNNMLANKNLIRNISGKSKYLQHYISGDS